ncbi:DNA repair protein RadC [Candidatus Neomarinimicrobiota bacterium]
MNDYHPFLDQVSDEDLRQAYRDRFKMNVGECFSDSSQVADHLMTVLDGRDRETFVVLFLNGRNALIATEVVFEGTLTQAIVFPREIVKYALLKNAASIIAAHNHPSGEIGPSGDDQQITRKIKQACEAVGVQLLDHLIIAAGEFFSFADSGLL